MPRQANISNSLLMANTLSQNPRQAASVNISPAISTALLNSPAIAAALLNNSGGTPAPTPAPAPAPAATPAPIPAPPVVPLAPGDDPFSSLPMPSPGDRIKADDFKKLSQALHIIADMAALSGSLFGRSFGDVKLALASQGYQIFRVMSVFGAEIDNLADASLDGRKVMQVLPVALGDPRVMVVVTEAVDTRRFVPNLVGLSYREAQERIATLIGDVPLTGAPPSAPQLLGLTLAQALQALNT